MKILEPDHRLPIVWEIRNFDESFALMQSAFKRNLKKNGDKDVFDLGPHIRTIQEKMLLEKRPHHLGFPVNTFTSAIRDMAEVLEVNDAEKIEKYKQDIIDVATWLYYNPPPEVKQREIMIAS